MEVWKDVVGYEGIYKVSNKGKVKSIRNNKEKLLSLAKAKDGYLSVGLYKNGKGKMQRIHSLIAKSFIDSSYIEKGLVVNHINFIRDDNRLENLEIVTQRENTSYKRSHKTSVYCGVVWHKIQKKWVASIRVGGIKKYLGSFDSEEEAYKYYELALDCINEGRICDIKVKRVVRSSTHRHIHFHKASNKWHTKALKHGEYVYLGLFKTEQEALFAQQNYQKLHIQ